MPTLEQKQGDFSQTFTSAGRPFVIYDPLTVAANPSFDPARAVTLTNLQYTRTPFTQNRVPQTRMNPIAQHVLNDIPAPNQTGDPVTHLNNWYAGYVSSDLNYQNLIGRLDHTISNAWKIFAHWNYNFRNGGHINYDGWDSPARRATHLTRHNDGAALDAVGTLRAHTVLSARLGFNRFKEESIFTPLDVSSLGFPKAFTTQLQIPNKYPIFTFENYLQTSKVEQRFRSGLTYLVSYTISKTMEAISFLNASDQRPSRELTTFDTPRRFVVSGFYELPVGPRKSLLSKGLVSHIVGGWQLTWTSVIQSGPPMSYPDYYIYGNPKLTSGQTLIRWFNTSKDIWVQRPADTLRTTPMRSPNIPPHGAAGRPGIDQAVLHPGRSQI